MGNTGDTLFLIRARGFDALARLLAERLSGAGVPVLAVVDERGGPAETAPFDKLSLTEEALARIGISGLPPDWGWLCGDMCYYLAAAARPGHARYALLESDVFLPAAGAQDFIRALAASPAQAIAAGLGPTDAPKRYSRGLARLGLDPAWGCLFPVTCLAAPVIAAMRALRQDAQAMGPGEKLNDEAVLAGAIQRHRFSHARLEDVAAGQVPKASFFTNPPHLFEAVAADPTERRLFHPVAPFDRVIERIRTGEKAYTRTRLRRVLNTAPKPMKRAIKDALAKAEAPE